MTELRNVAMVCPADFDQVAGELTNRGREEVGLVVGELMVGYRLIDPVIVTEAGSDAAFATGDLYLTGLVKEGGVLLSDSRLREQDAAPETRSVNLRAFFESLIIGEPPRRPGIMHIGNLVTVMSPKVIAAIAGLDPGSIRPDKAYFPELG